MDYRFATVVIGDDFHFGRGREGTVSTLTLENAGRTSRLHGGIIVPLFCSVANGSAVLVFGRPWHKVNMQLAHTNYSGDLTRCAGGWVTVNSAVVPSVFPRRTSPLHRLKSPISGVFAVYLHGLHDHPLPGIANLGIRPTVDGKSHLLEVHLFDINEMFYGQYVEIEFVKKIREEQRFDSFSALKIQIEQDVIQAKQALFP
jgi:riboflavin kinase / FMN adenylyltransferase